VIAGVAGFILIFIFLIAVYRTSGLMASISLLVYVMILLSLVKMLGIVLTLASVAGLILSIGMAIDANILIFERIKDEFKNTTNLHTASEAGFKKSWSAIWDSNITGLIVSLILFIFGINLIK
jgi:preprotein translocase subunit SecD